MSYDVIEGNWKTLKGEVHKYWGELTNNEIEKLDGSVESLLGLLQKKYGLEKNKAENQINDFIESQIPNDLKEDSENFLDKYIEKFSDTSSTIKNKTTSSIKKSPFKIIGCAMVTGFLLSQLIK